MPELVYLALGSNLGDRERSLAEARGRIGRIPGVTIECESAIEETPPLGGRDQPAYLNQMLAVTTTLDPSALLAALHAVEVAGGRVRRKRWDSRSIDIDIVRFGDRHETSDTLTVPHPELANRDFWQRELAELGANVQSSR